MPNLDGFAPIVAKKAKILILGTMPGVASLEKQQYYGHPRNAFWSVMKALLAMGSELCYEERKQVLTNNGIAVWDVLESCARAGSLDANIDMQSIRINRFEEFFTENNSIKHVFFNGAMAEKLYRTYGLPTLSGKFPYLHYQRLPSTSPANASLNLAQKIEAWQIVTRSMVK
ncbi:MAG: DNA-deoxyinosine glycosylase [Methylococcaceae bacterium]|nr:DNA-deoxyinosine glycosylase [Methylococcaceae bacterium]